MEKCNNIPYEERNPQLDMFRPVLANLNKIKREINISLGDLKNQWDKQRGICVYSGIKLLLPEWNIPRKHPKMASLDRIDSNKGYIKNNIQFVSVIANYAKNEMTNEEMIYFCKEVAKFWRNKC